MALAQIHVSWSGGPVVGPSASTFYFDSANAASVRAALHDFFTDVKTFLPLGLSIVVPNSGDTIDIVSGQPDGIWTDSTVVENVNSSGNGVYAEGVGASVAWRTAVFTNGRRLVGRTFLCPLIGTAFQSSTGTLSGSAQSTIQVAADLHIVTPGHIEVYSRTHSISSTIVASSVSDQVSWLRSRRT